MEDLITRIAAAKARWQIRYGDFPVFIGPTLWEVRPFQLVDLFLLARPTLSTWTAALTISTVWLVAVIALLFYNALASGAEYDAAYLIRSLLTPTFIMIIVSIYKDSFIYERYSKGRLYKSEKSTFIKTSTYFLFGLILMVALPNILSIPSQSEFMLLNIPEETPQRSLTMALSWLSAVESQNSIIMIILMVWTFQVGLHKKTSLTHEWDETSTHVKGMIRRESGYASINKNRRIKKNPWQLL